MAGKQNIKIGDDTMAIKDEVKVQDDNVKMPGVGDGQIKLTIDMPDETIKVTDTPNLEDGSVKIGEDGTVEVEPVKEPEKKEEENQEDGDDQDQDNQDVDPAVREARRLKNRATRQANKERRKAAEANYKKEINELRGQVDELKKQVSGSATTSKIDKDESDIQRLRDVALAASQQAEKDYKESFKDGDVEKNVEALKKWQTHDAVLAKANTALENIKRIKENPELLENFQKRTTKQVEKPNGQDHAENLDLDIWRRQFVRDNPWYGKEGNQRDTRTAVVISEELLEEGFSPDNQDYWDELQNRIDDEIPHRLGKQEKKEDRMEDRQEEKQDQRQQNRRVPVAPRNTRESGAPSNSRVPAESLLTDLQKTALEQANIQKGSKEWKEIVAYYIDQNRKEAAAKN